MNYAFQLCYDGTNYSGWQIQKNANTVQAELEKALFAVLGCKISVVASGRTDSGVHAAAQICNFNANLSLPPEKLAAALNPFLPPDIKILRSCKAEDDFNANKSAKKKTYCYRLYQSETSNPLKDRYAVQVTDVNVEKLRRIAACFLGEHNFKAYQSSGATVLTTVRKIYSIDVVTKKFQYGKDIEIFVCGNGFLYNMVRTMVGTMLYYAWGRISEDDIKKSLETGERRLVGKTMPPQGLTLESVDYGELFKFL